MLEMMETMMKTTMSMMTRTIGMMAPMVSMMGIMIFLIVMRTAVETKAEMAMVVDGLTT